MNLHPQKKKATNLQEQPARIEENILSKKKTNVTLIMIVCPKETQESKQNKNIYTLFVLTRYYCLLRSLSPLV
jgi:hypothetical protein